jgi:hypothetical protein
MSCVLPLLLVISDHGEGAERVSTPFASVFLKHQRQAAALFVGRTTGVPVVTTLGSPLGASCIPAALSALSASEVTL